MSTGAKVLWNVDVGYGYSSVVIQDGRLYTADGKLITLDVNGTLHIAKATPEGYTELAAVDVLKGAKKSRVFPTPPVLCGGRIYCRNYAGDLVCIDVRS